MGTIHNADPSELIEKASEELKKIRTIKAPDWALYVKTGMHKERPPIKNDWWYIRSASVLRQVYRMGPIGVSKLRNKYGGKKNRGVKPEHFFKGSGSIARKILQQLETEGFVRKDLKNVHKGRSITAKGKKFLDDVAKTISKAQPVKVEKKPKETPKKETKQITTPVKKEIPIKKEAKKIETKEIPKKIETPIKKEIPVKTEPKKIETKEIPRKIETPIKETPKQ